MTTFDEFFADHYDEVVRTLALAVGDRSRAEDAAQEAFARAFRKWPTVSAMDRPVGWVVVVGVNQMKRWITRGEKHAQPASAADATTRIEGSPHAPDLAEAIADGTSLRTALDRLGPRQRATVVLRYLCDLPTADVAQALGCSPGTVKSALSAGLANLRVDLADDEHAIDLGRRSASTTAAPRRAAAPRTPTEPTPGEEATDAHR